MCIVCSISGTGYLILSLLSDVTRGIVYLPIVLIGGGEIGTIICSQILIANESPEKSRGTCASVFSIFGAAGVLFVTKVGGTMFDKIGPSSPFILYAILNYLLFIITLFYIICYFIQYLKQKS
jgi:MFS family permease